MQNVYAKCVCKAIHLYHPFYGFYETTGNAFGLLMLQRRGGPIMQYPSDILLVEFILAIHTYTIQPVTQARLDQLFMTS